MIKFRYYLIIIISILIIVALFYVDYSNLSWSNNRGYYLAVINGILLIILNVVEIRNE